MAQANLTGNGKQTETLQQLRCVAGWTDEIHKQLIFISAINIFMSITAFLGNILILLNFPSQRIFSSSAVQTPVPLSGNNRFLCWPYYRASPRCLLDVSGSRRLGTLSICANHGIYSRLYFVISLSVNNHCN